tara:strand:+ start:1216 stop:1605 length:390 start_codon:yes stop_codon:yes gene_type:complete
MLANLVFTLISSVLGIMLFFSFVVAPLGFKTLSEKSFRKFIRKIFPFYYSINLFLLIVASIPIYIYHGMNFSLALILVCAGLFAVSLFILMPMINKFRDKNKLRKFKIAHTTSVIINFVQIFILIVVIF